MSTRILFAVAALAGATLCLESALTRLLAVAQFYHFAFLVISLALLGFAASGTLLSISKRLQGCDPQYLLAGSGIAFAGSVGLAYLVVSRLPFDSYAIAIDRRQIAYFGLYYLALSLPFLCSGLGIAAVLAAGGCAQPYRLCRQPARLGWGSTAGAGADVPGRRTRRAGGKCYCWARCRGCCLWTGSIGAGG